MGSNSKLPNLNKVLIRRNLTKDPELRFTRSGVPVVNLRIASSKRYKDSLGSYREEVCHIGVVAWQKPAQSCSQFLKKGNAVLVEGELRSNLREGENGSKRNFIEIRTDQIQFLDKQRKTTPEEPSPNDFYSLEQQIRDFDSLGN